MKVGCASSTDGCLWLLSLVSGLSRMGSITLIRQFRNATGSAVLIMKGAFHVAKDEPLMLASNQRAGLQKGLMFTDVLWKPRES